MIDTSWGLATGAVALALFAVVGLRARGGDRDLEDYLVARDSQSAGTLGLSFMASGLGAWILFAPPEVAAFVGLVGLLGYAIGAGGPIVLFALLGPRLRRVVPHGHSLTEFVRVRFGRGVHRYVVGVSLLYMWVFVVAELGAVSAVGSIVAGVDPIVTVVAVTAVTVAYTAYGGLRASLRTDRWQAWLIFGLLGLGTLAIGTRVDASVNPVRGAGLLALSGTGVETALTLIIAVTVANVFHQGYWQRVWSARDDRALRRGGWLGVAITVPVVFVAGAVGLWAVGAGAPLGEPPAPFFAVLAGLPDWVGAVVLALGLALVASSVDTLENALAALVVAERPGLRVSHARVVTVALLVPAAVVALQVSSVLRTFLVADLLAATIAVPALAGLWARTTPAAALSGALSGLVGAVAWSWADAGSLAGAWDLVSMQGAVTTLPPFLGALVGSSLVTVAVSLVQGRTTDLERLGAQVQAFAEA